MRLLLLLTILLTGRAFADNYLIHAGQLFDSQSGKFISHQSIYVNADKITDVTDGFASPAEGEQLIDLSESFVMPGLMDMHVHLTHERGPKQYQDIFRLNPAGIAYQAQVYARITLAAGFTTVRNVGDMRAIGDTAPVSVALKNAIDKGLIDGPRIYTAGRAISVTGGHFDATSGLNSTLMGDPSPKTGVVNGPDDVRKSVRQRYKEGADLIKIAVTGGMLSTTRDGRAPQFASDELAMVVSTAHDYGMTVAAHAHGQEGIRRAVAAGVDSIEHGTELNKDILTRMKKQGIYLVPTMMAPNFGVEKAKQDGFFPKIVRDKIIALQFEKIVPDMVRMAYKMGVNIAYGTDSGVTPHGDNAQEFSLMVAAGIPAEKVLQSATIHSARLLKIDDKLGSIEPTKLADIVAVNGNPLDDISIMENIDFVMKNGVIYKQQ